MEMTNKTRAELIEELRKADELKAKIQAELNASSLIELEKIVKDFRLQLHANEFNLEDARHLLFPDSGSTVKKLSADSSKLKTVEKLSVPVEKGRSYIDSATKKIWVAGQKGPIPRWLVDHYKAYGSLSDIILNQEATKG